MTSPSKFAHVVFATYRYEEMIDFYQSVFEARTQTRDDRFCFATYDDEHHRFAFMNLGPMPDGPPVTPAPMGTTPGVAHLSYTWENLAGLVEVYKRVRDLYGKKPFFCVKHGPTLSMYYRDPDGNHLEFQIDLLDADAANAFMAGPEFAANPVGEPFDPIELVRHFDAGEPLQRYIFRSDQPAVELDGVRL